MTVASRPDEDANDGAPLVLDLGDPGCYLVDLAGALDLGDRESMTSRNCTVYVCDFCHVEVEGGELEGPKDWWWLGSYGRGIDSADCCSMQCLVDLVADLAAREGSGVVASPVDGPAVAAEPESADSEPVLPGAAGS